MKLTYKTTAKACYLGYITQAAVNNLAPLLFIVFNTKYGLSYDLISVLILLNFITQLATDALSVKLCHVLSTRTLVVSAHIMCAAGLLMMGVLPMLIPVPFAGLCAAVIIYAVGGGLIEVLVSPIIEALPEDGRNKAAAMSLLHSFYCWGQAAVILLSTGYIAFFGDGIWYLLPMFWALLPAANAILFTKAPLVPEPPPSEQSKLRSVFTRKGFILIMILMLCAGACELTISQWSSMFAQRGLEVTKAVGDLLGPCLFALLMGGGRLLNSLLAHKINLYAVLTASGVLCAACYVTVSLSDNALLSLTACAVCGLSVAVMWPGTFSLAAEKYKDGGTGMFGIMALCGDLGCASGPFLAGMICDTALSSGATEAEGMRAGFSLALIFPILLTVGAILLRRTGKNN
ncbi:MAG: MFS transporter [Eubacterium sp.]|nr:MFS transporter [Eubacterium sp.]